MNRLLLFLNSILIMSFIILGCQQKDSGNHFAQDLNNDWQLFSSAGIDAGGDAISRPDFDPGAFYQVDIPATIMSGLIQNGLFPDVYLEKRLEDVDRSLFDAPWWYRRIFSVANATGNYYHLRFEGINYKANIWVNGQLVADSTKIEGPFGMWTLDVSGHIHTGENAIAVEVFAPQKGDLTIGFVDWSPEAPDRNTGLWRGVILRETGPVSISNPHVVSLVNTETLDEARLSIAVTAKNHSNKPQTATITAAFNGQEIAGKFNLLPHEEIELTLSPNQYKELIINNPKLWWPVNLGEQHLYDMALAAMVDNAISDHQAFRFGIRQIDSFRTEDDQLGFKVNGQKILIKGGGWVDDMLLADSDEKVIAQVDYVKHMNLNTIRLEGFWGRNKTLYDRCDEQGILLMIGWSCQWEWEYYSGRPQDDYIAIHEPEEQHHHARAYTDQVKWLRNHPSVFLWNFGSDKLPRPELEQLLYDYLETTDTSRPLLSHCGSRVSSISGTSGVKMHGPYDWVSPNYWYIDKRYGGAYGFNTETGPGPQIPTLETIKRMFPEGQRWPMNDLWNYHSGRFEFNNIDRFLRAFHARYGAEETLERFVFKNQISSYEAVRPMFEAFTANKYHSTGVIQWMLNSAWPKIIWQLYDYYLIPNGAFYATRKACAPLSPIYHYGKKSVYVNNSYLHDNENLKLTVKVFDINANLLMEQIKDVSIKANSAMEVVALPDTIQGLTPTWFLDLRLLADNGTELANNFYWLSTKEDTHDWDATYWVYTPGQEFADLQGINTMPRAALNHESRIIKDGDDLLVVVDLENTSDVIAFFTELRAFDKTTDKTIVPVFWDDNYVSLLPGEKRTITARISASLVDRKNIEMAIEGWNL
jgi:exo-1,4-beta-D-glucosaminidase